MAEVAYVFNAKTKENPHVYGKYWWQNRRSYAQAYGTVGLTPPESWQYDWVNMCRLDQKCSWLVNDELGTQLEWRFNCRSRWATVWKPKVNNMNVE